MPERTGDSGQAPPWLRPLEGIGARALDLLEVLGRFGAFFAVAVATLLTPPFKVRQFVDRVHFIGYKSLVIIVLTGAFTGMVLALQLYLTLTRFGSEAFLGPAVALSLIRELGPVLAALMVTGRAGSALTAEIGIMRITEQIDALTVMALNPVRYLVTPSILAGLLTFPLMTAIFDVLGIAGGYLVAVELFGVSHGTYFGEMQSFVRLDDILTGFWKSVSFGAVVTWVCTYKGFHVGHGAEGVARATTQAVVLASVLILVWDYFMGSVLP
jgi:phospholipid/cholesterol/gamma-HCH transport system permease protein